MAYYYIDFENTHNLGMDGIELLPAGDKVLIFFRKEDPPHITPELAENMARGEAGVMFIPCVTGTPNALDFQLVAELFIRIRRGQQIYVVSRDKGYKAIFEAVENRGAKIDLIRSIRDNDELSIEEVPAWDKYDNINALFGQSISTPYSYNAAIVDKMPKLEKMIADLMYEWTGVVPTPEAVHDISNGFKACGTKDDLRVFCQHHFGQTIGFGLYDILKHLKNGCNEPKPASIIRNEEKKKTQRSSEEIRRRLEELDKLDDEPEMEFRIGQDYL